MEGWLLVKKQYTPWQLMNSHLS